MTTEAAGAHAGIAVRLLPLAGGLPDAAWFDWLDAAERARAERLRRPADRARFVAARVLLRATLGEVTGRPARAWRFTADEAGKPRIAEPVAAAGVTFSISHTSGLVAVAVDAAGRRVGIDAERRGRRVAPALARRILSARERADLADLDAAAMEHAVLRRWVLKEALAKAVGSGIALSLRRLACTGIDPPRVEFEAAPDVGRPCDWHLATGPGPATHHLAVAAEAAGEPPALDWARRTPADLARALTAACPAVGG